MRKTAIYTLIARPPAHRHMGSGGEGMLQLCQGREFALLPTKKVHVFGWNEGMSLVLDNNLRHGVSQRHGQISP